MIARFTAVMFSGALMLGVALSACTDAGKCLRGEPGCACKNDGTCGEGAICGGAKICLERGDGGVPDAGPPPDVDCTGHTLEEVCSQFCEALCQNQARFCFASECSSDACAANGEVSGPCAQECSTATTESARVACARNLCMNQLSEDMTCESFGFEVDETFINLCLDADPVCVPKPELGCSNTCGTSEGVGGNLVMNNRCEDGHDEDSVSSRCPRGTDCDDCGPHPCVPPLEECVNHGDCCGFFGTGALCVDPDGATGEETPYCLLRCNEEEECSEGFRCVGTDGAGSVCVPD